MKMKNENKNKNKNRSTQWFSDNQISKTQNANFLIALFHSELLLTSSIH